MRYVIIGSICHVNFKASCDLGDKFSIFHVNFRASYDLFDKGLSVSC